MQAACHPPNGTARALRHGPCIEGRVTATPATENDMNRLNSILGLIALILVIAAAVVFLDDEVNDDSLEIEISSLVLSPADAVPGR